MRLLPGAGSVIPGCVPSPRECRPPPGLVLRRQTPRGGGERFPLEPPRPPRATARRLLHCSRLTTGPSSHPPRYLSGSSIQPHDHRAPRPLVSGQIWPVFMRCYGPGPGKCHSGPVPTRPPTPGAGSPRHTLGGRPAGPGAARSARPAARFRGPGAWIRNRCGDGIPHALVTVLSMLGSNRTESHPERAAPRPTDTEVAHTLGITRQEGRRPLAPAPWLCRGRLRLESRPLAPSVGLALPAHRQDREQDLPRRGGRRAGRRDAGPGHTS
jgi:hypothetical protein